MKLDSVRELKTDLSARVIGPLQKSAARLLSFSARPLGRVEAVQPTIALGIVRRGKNVFRLGVRIQRREIEGSPALDAIRKAAKGEIDERYVGRIVKQATPWRRRRNRPLLIGGSVGHHRITAGTLGCFVTSSKDQSVLILSNNHVLADENRGKLGDPILQPGPYDGGTRPQDAIGVLAGFAKLKRTGANRVDAAVAKLRDGIAQDFKRLPGLGTLAGPGDDFLDADAPVAKLGRTTGLTRGRVTMFEADNVVVEYDIGPLKFDDQIEIESAADAPSSRGSRSISSADGPLRAGSAPSSSGRRSSGDGPSSPDSRSLSAGSRSIGSTDGPFSAGGDSGSLIVDADLRGVGLLFAGSDQGGSNGLGLTYANPLRAVLESLNVELLY